MAGIEYFAPTGNAMVDGLLSGVRWTGPVQYGVTTSAGQYIYGPEPDGFVPLSGSVGQVGTQLWAVQQAFASVASFTAISLTQNTVLPGLADICLAMTITPDLDPGEDFAAYTWALETTPWAGHVWFNTTDYNTPDLGTYGYLGFLHETGHALGLKHPHEADGGFPLLPLDQDSPEFTVMTYRDYVGDAPDYYAIPSGNGVQSYMQLDIAALQEMYGANFTYRSGNTTYRFDPNSGEMLVDGAGQGVPSSMWGIAVNVLFRTIWDGGGTDTYDFSAYGALHQLAIDLRPGAWTDVDADSHAQAAWLGGGPNGGFARGQIANALLFDNDLRSLIENAIGGAGGDTIIGNQVANTLSGGGGDDVLEGWLGDDRLEGGAGNDTVRLSANRTAYAFTASGSQVTCVGPDGTDTCIGVEAFAFSDGMFSRHTLLNTVAVESLGATRLKSDGVLYFLRDSADEGPGLSFIGAAFNAGQFGPWAPIGAEADGAGYKVAFKNGALDQFIIWNTDAAGNYSSLATGVVAGTSTALQLLETTFQQDLNGNGAIGLVPVAIETFGATKLVQLADTFALHNAGNTGPSLKLGGVDVVAGQFGPWAPIGAEADGSGYKVAFKNGGLDQFIVWNTDAAGNFSGLATGVVAGTSTALQLLETTFQQDLNGNGAIGLVPVAIETLGVTKLVQLADTFALHNAGNTGPSLKLGGVDVVAGQFGPWAPIAAEADGGGYKVAFKNGGLDQFIIWNTDAAGNYSSLATGVVAGSSAALQLLETTFQQDLNGNGAIGLVPVAIETLGVTKLVQLADTFALHNAGNTGPSLKLGGTEVLAGQFGPWTPMAAEADGAGYKVAFKNGGLDQFIIWNTDAAGNYSSLATGVVAGTSTALQLLETTFQQDLNGNGAIGLVPVAIESLGATKLVQLADTFALHNAGNTGPSLKLGGVDVVAGQFGPWAPIGAEADGAGYKVAFKNGGLDQFIVWNTDSIGNYSGLATGVVAGTSTALQLLETTFQQDLNGDGILGV